MGSRYVLPSLESLGHMYLLILKPYPQPDTSSFGLLHWVRRSEQNINSTDLVVLVETVENLYYSLYARVVIELANIELCGTFRSNRRSLRIHRPFLLPEADHLYRIILGFKDTLHSPSICPAVRKEPALYFQQAYISQIVDKAKNTDSSSEDPLGYRLHAATVVSDRDGPYCTKWKALISFFNVIPSSTMALMSEKYLAITPVAVMPDDVPFDQLPFIKPTKVGEDIRDTDTVKDHHMGALAKLEGTTIGEERHKDPKCRIYHLAKQRKCVCYGVCRCSKECTNDVLRDCPCAERHVRIMTIKRGLHYRWPGCAFPTTAGTMIRMYFHGLASMKRGVTNHHIALELHRAFESIDALITAEREREKEISQENVKRSS